MNENEIGEYLVIDIITKRLVGSYETPELAKKVRDHEDDKVGIIRHMVMPKSAGLKMLAASMKTAEHQ